MLKIIRECIFFYVKMICMAFFFLNEILMKCLGSKLMNSLHVFSESETEHDQCCARFILWLCYYFSHITLTWIYAHTEQSVNGANISICSYSSTKQFAGCSYVSATNQ